jgi:hypothetical protein
MTADPIDIGNGVKLSLVSNTLTLFPSALGTQTKYGWNGTNWIKDYSSDKYITNSSITLLDGTQVTFNNATGKNYDEQFVQTERFTYVYGPYKIKDNLQTVNIKARKYVTAARIAGDPTPISITIPATPSYTYVISEVSNPDFRELDTVDFLTEVYNGATRYTRFTLPTATTFTVNHVTNNSILNVSVNIATGTPCKINTNLSQWWTSTLPRYGFVNEGIYFAINVSPTQIKLAATYADAIAGTPITFVDDGYGTLYIQPVIPTTGTYYAGTNGLFVFSAADASAAITLVYTYTLFN